MTRRSWTRRAFIGAGVAVGGGLLVGAGGIAFAPTRLRYLPEGEHEGTHLTTWIRITPDDEVQLLVPHCEMGQGALTGIAMMAADELDADWARVRILEAPADPAFANGHIMMGFLDEAGIGIPGWMDRAAQFGAYLAAQRMNLQTTGGSTATRGTGWHGLRLAGAAARQMLVAAGSDHLGVPERELVTRASRVVHEPSGRSATFGELAELAATRPVPRTPRPKTRSEYRIVGRSHPRSDLPAKVRGEAIYGIDVVVPGLLYATLRAAPVPGGRLASSDRAAALAVPGVVEVVELSDAVAVVAEGYWHASRGLEAARPEFTAEGRGMVDSPEIDRRIAAALDEAAPDLPADGDPLVAAEYRVPYLAHATMEPMAATARLESGRLEVWAGTQDPLNARQVAADAAGLDADQVTFHNTQLGGGFGRRLPGNFDYVRQAVRVAQAVSPRPVKLIWSREEDIRHDYYRPVVQARMWAQVDDSGRPTRWIGRFNGGRFDTRSARPPYSVRRVDLEAVPVAAHLREGAWRSVASSQHGFFLESFIDELAHRAGEDPLRYRLDLLAGHPRHRAVLEAVAAMSGWDTTPATGRARGVAIVESFGSIVAEVAEVSIGSDGRVRVHAVDAAVDCGLVVNPDQALAQIEGGIVFGLSAALHQEITVRNGAVEQRNFTDFPALRLSEAPDIRVRFLDSDAPMGGLGEPGVPPIAPAVANAVFALTGERVRALPIRVAGTPTA